MSLPQNMGTLIRSDSRIRSDLGKGILPFSCRLNIQLPAILSKPSSSLFIIRDDRANQAPELPRVVFYFQMTKLVNDHIVDNRQGRENEPPVEMKSIFGCAASPAAFLLTDPNDEGR